MAITISGDTHNFSAATITALTAPTSTITTLNAPSGVLATQNGMTGICKAWVNFAGASGAVNGSFNVSLVTRNTAGNYTITFTTPMANANYTVSGAVSAEVTGFGFLNIYSSGGGAPATMTTSAVRVSALGYTNYYDPNTVTVVIHGT
jgi:hypothetical protein